MATPHISAEPGDFAESILLPGDPLRARFIAENFLTDVRQVTAVRNMLGFTGQHDGMAVSVMGTGMGIPSASIYATELIRIYGVRRLVRVGSCGGIGPDARLRDVIIATGASTDSGVNRSRFNGMDFAATADFGLARASVEAAEARGTAVKTGVIHSGDLFYVADPTIYGFLEKMGVLGVENEAAGLYGLAAEYGARALTIATIAGLIGQDIAMTSDERQHTLAEMIAIALDGLHRDLERTG
jgi:purine-nucleoside phosphorylase